MLTRISIITGVIIATINLAVLFGVHLNPDQLAGINMLLAVVGAAIHSWFDPNVPIGPTNP